MTGGVVNKGVTGQGVWSTKGSHDTWCPTTKSLMNGCLLVFKPTQDRQTANQEKSMEIGGCMAITQCPSLHSPHPPPAPPTWLPAPCPGGTTCCTPPEDGCSCVAAGPSLTERTPADGRDGHHHTSHVTWMSPGVTCKSHGCNMDVTALSADLESLLQLLGLRHGVLSVVQSGVP